MAWVSSNTALSLSMDSSANTQRHLAIERVRVRRGKIDLHVKVDINVLHVSQDQAQRVLCLLPNLQNHVCVNGAGETFGDELLGTEQAHLLEHVIIELQGKALLSESRVMGHTSWLVELSETRPQGYALMRTSVAFANDFVALQAAKDAGRIVEWSIDPQMCAEPDVSAIIEHLVALSAMC